MFAADLTFKGFGIITTAYVAPTISPKGWITWWPGQHSSWKHGFVVRFFWLGFLVRWGRRKLFLHQRRMIEQAIQQANDGDYFLDFLDEEPH